MNNPMDNTAVRDAAIANFGDVLDHLLAPDEFGDRDHWPYQIVLTLPVTTPNEASPELLNVIGTVSTLASANGWTCKPSIPDDNSYVRLTVTLPAGWDVEHLQSFQVIVDLAHAGRINIGVEGKPIPPVVARADRNSGGQ